MDALNKYRGDFNRYLSEKIDTKSPHNLYDPIKYILDLGGKRIRPLLVMFAADIYEADKKEGLAAALAVEVFHNFTLIHDDIMDAAPIRRGKATVHHKWNENIGILSGDAMLIKAYSFIEVYPDKIYRNIMNLFNKTALEVCEGQQFDMDFEKLEEVSIEQYIEMIRLKTGVLLASALEIGAIIGNASENDRKVIYQFGINLGIAFQLQDDYLDTFGDEKSFGKQIGGDILEHKKTFLYLTALKNSSLEDKKELLSYYQDADKSSKIKKVTSFFEQHNVPILTQQAIENYTQKSFKFIDDLSIPSDKKALLREFGNQLMNRNV